MPRDGAAVHVLLTVFVLRRVGLVDVAEQVASHRNRRSGRLCGTVDGVAGDVRVVVHSARRAAQHRVLGDGVWIGPDVPDQRQPTDEVRRLLHDE